MNKHVLEETLLKGKERNGVVDGRSKTNRGLFLIDGSNKNMFLCLMTLLLFSYL